MHRQTMTTQEDDSMKVREIIDSLDDRMKNRMEEQKQQILAQVHDQCAQDPIRGGFSIDDRLYRVENTIGQKLMPTVDQMKCDSLELKDQQNKLDERMNDQKNEFIQLIEKLKSKSASIEEQLALDTMHQRICTLEETISNMDEQMKTLVADADRNEKQQERRLQEVRSELQCQIDSLHPNTIPAINLYGDKSKDTSSMWMYIHDLYQKQYVDVKILTFGLAFVAMQMLIIAICK